MLNKHYLALLTISTGLLLPASGQLVIYDFEGDTPSPTVTADGVTASAFSRNEGNSVQYSAGNESDSSISGSGWMGADATNGEFWEFTVTADPGLTLELTALDFDYRSTGSGPTDWELSINGEMADTGVFLNDSSFHTLFIPLSYSSLSVATVRITGFNASASGGTLRMDDVTLNGVVAPVPEPATWVLLGIGAVGLAWHARRRR